MIPKIIHYCWFGGNPLPEKAQACLDSWRKYCPDYEIVEWNETNFDLSSNPYVKEAAACKKWAFVSDYVRLYALVQQGGIYMDTDVELLKSPAPFLSASAFAGFENGGCLGTGLLAAEQGHPTIRYLLSDYDNRHFLLPDGSMDQTTNVITITELLSRRYNFRPDNTFQQFEDGFTIYPKDYFCAKSVTTGKLELTENTVAIHHFSGTWLSEEELYAKHLKQKFTGICNHKCMVYLAQLLAWIRYHGVTGTVKLLRAKKGT